jgi:hypothetical protein
MPILEDAATGLDSIMLDLFLGYRFENNNRGSREMDLES